MYSDAYFQDKNKQSTKKYTIYISKSCIFIHSISYYFADCVAGTDALLGESSASMSAKMSSSG